MKALATKEAVELALANRFGDVFERHDRQPLEILSSGLSEIDSVLRGFPRGAITEIHGQASSGRTSLMMSTLAAATARDEICAVVDCDETFDLLSAAVAGVDFKRVLWVRCGHKLERAFKAVDLILHAGGFGCVALNLCDVSPNVLRRIISSWWFRFRRAIENTPTALVVLTSVAAVRSCAVMALELNHERAVWPGTVSLVSENSIGRFTAPTSHNGSHLSLVHPIARYEPPAETHLHFFQAMQIRVNCQRPLTIQPATMKFHPHLNLSPLEMFADIR